MYLEDLTAGVRVDGAEDVVKEVDVAVLVDGAGELDALLLATAEVDPALADFCLIAELHHLHVLLQAAHPDHLLVPLPVHRLPEQDVLLDGAVLDPSRLRHVRRRAAHLDLQCKEIQNRSFCVCQSIIVRCSTHDKQADPLKK